MNESNLLFNVCSLFLCFGLCLSLQDVIAQDADSAQSTRTAADNETQIPDGQQTAESDQEQLDRLLMLSAKIVEKIEEDGLSRDGIEEQKKLYRELDLLVNQAKENRVQPIQSRGDDADQTEAESESMSGSVSSGNKGDGAGQAPITEQGRQPDSALRLRQNLADSVWGHLPPQERQDLIRTYSESYLPEYEQQVRSYFEKLAKLKRRSASSEAAQPGDSN